MRNHIGINYTGDYGLTAQGAAHTFGFLESIILTAVTNSVVFGLGPAAVSFVAGALTTVASLGSSEGMAAGSPRRRS